MMGDIICGPLYLFYSSEKNGLQNRILYHLLIEAIKVRNTSAIHLFCGHNRNLRESINFDMLLKIIKRAEIDKSDAFNRIHFFYAFTQPQTTNTIEKISEILTNESQITVVTVQNIEHLFSKPPTISKATQEFYKKKAYDLINLCREAGTPIVASAPLSNHGRPIPVPEGGISLTQLAGVSLYFSNLRSGGATAYIHNHYDKNRIGLRIDLNATELKKTRQKKPWKRTSEWETRHSSITRT